MTQPDKPRAARVQAQPSPVKQVALAEEIPVFQPENAARRRSSSSSSRARSRTLSVVVAYGHILPQTIIDLPRSARSTSTRRCCPLLRGAAPIQAAIREGFAETGVTIMQMVPALDAGPILLQARTPILEDETSGELQLRLTELGALAPDRGARAHRARQGEAETPQDDARGDVRGEVTRESARIDWTDSAHEVARHIRAYDPKPGAFTRRRGGEVKLFGAARSSTRTRRTARRGARRRRGRMLVIACGVDALRVTGVQPAGKSRLTAHEWARGRGIAVGEGSTRVTASPPVKSSRCRGCRSSTPSPTTRSSLRAGFLDAPCAVMRALGTRGALHLRVAAARHADRVLRSLLALLERAGADRLLAHRQRPRRCRARVWRARRAAHEPLALGRRRAAHRAGARGGRERAHACRGARRRAGGRGLARRGTRVRDGDASREAATRTAVRARRRRGGGACR